MNIDAPHLGKDTATLLPGRKHSYLPIILPLAMLGAILFLDAALPLGGFWFHTALLSTLGSWSLLPTHLLFPGWAVSSSITSANPTPPAAILGWLQMPFLISAFIIIFLLYVLALYRLPRHITSYRYIFYSTLLLGGLYLLFPVVTSPDIFSYIAYARIGVIYHLNPLTTLPTAIHADPVYPQLYWNDQPSAYGPVWAGITCVLQWLTLVFGTQSLVPMVLALRLLGLVTHLCSTLLIWSIVGRVQLLQGQVSTTKRWLATFAFAWNPLLLFEATVNAHNDAQLLLFVLLALWFLLPTPQTAAATPQQAKLPILTIVMLALAACLKINLLVLLPFVLLFLYKQSRRPLLTVTTAVLLFGGIIILLYAPFWQNGAILNIVHTNPTTSRDINTLPEFLSRLYNSMITDLGFPRPPYYGSAAEATSHTLSIGLFVILYALLGWQALRSARALRSLPSLFRWLTMAWLLYCAIGTPWFWPWYTVTFFGLYALAAATSTDELPLFGLTRLPLIVALLAFSMLSIYCFYAWGPHDTYIPGLPDFQWAYLRGLWAWLIPLLALHGNRNPRIAQRYHVSPEKPSD
ncbi:MAG: hypothetical protein ACR2H5_10500 [Ktedonobacteraceae bacterium]